VSNTRILIALLLLIACSSIIGFYPIYFIQIQVNQDHCRIFSNHLELQWIHSVEKTTWLEHYQIKHKKFVLQYTDFVSFGAGTPTHYPIIFQKNGWIRMDVNLSVKDIYWTISNHMQGIIIFQHQQWSIYKDYPDYSIVHISIQQQPLWRVLRLGQCL